jgi:hypothetical protein
MAEAPEVKPHDEVRIGIRRAVVCQVYDQKRVEVVYLDDRDRAINEDAVWRSGKWDFEHSGPNGGYADKYDRLSAFVAQLRRPRT